MQVLHKQRKNNNNEPLLSSPSSPSSPQCRSARGRKGKKGKLERVKRHHEIRRDFLVLHSTPCLLLLLPVVLLVLSVSESEGGLSVDHHPNPPSAVFGSPCNVFMYEAYQVPLLEILVRYSGEYAMQQVELSTFSEFSFLNRGTNNTENTTFIPKEYESQICHSLTAPLMCKADKEGDESGRGHCVCLHDFIVDKKDKDGKLTNVTFNITTVPTKGDYVIKNLDLNSLWKQDQGQESSSDNPGTTTSSTTSEIRTSESTGSLGRNFRGNDFETHRRPSYGAGETTNNLKANNNLSKIKCKAVYGSFCETPLISCLPYPEFIRGLNTTACTFSTCGNNTAAFIRPDFRYHLTSIFSISSILLF